MHKLKHKIKTIEKSFEAVHDNYMQEITEQEMAVRPGRECKCNLGLYQNGEIPMNYFKVSSHCRHQTSSLSLCIPVCFPIF